VRPGFDRHLRCPLSGTIVTVESLDTLLSKVYFLKMSDPAHLKVELIPLLENDNEYAKASLDPAKIELCKQANNSDTAKQLHDALKDHS
jgi:hypothetical protein